MTVVFTADVIKQMATPYELSDDLMQATLAALAPPPAGADATRRQVRLVRLVAEVAAFQPADAAQARLAAQILVLRELADALAQRAHARGDAGADVPAEPGFGGAAADLRVAGAHAEPAADATDAVLRQRGGGSDRYRRARCDVGQAGAAGV